MEALVKRQLMAWATGVLAALATLVTIVTQVSNSHGNISFTTTALVHVLA
jgi:hypothetical protein